MYDPGTVEEDPGETALAEFWVTNTGAAYDSIHVQTFDATGWLQATVDTIVMLDPYDSAYVTGLVDVPAAALAGDQDVITCTAVSLSDTLVSATDELAIVAAAWYQVDMALTVGTDTVNSPDTYAFTVNVDNQGNAGNTITVTPEGEADWAFVPPFTDITLGPGSDSTIGFTVYVPEEVVHQSLNNVTVNAESSGGAGDVESFTLYVHNPYFPPSLVSPEPAWNTQDGTPEFAWSSDGDSYTLYVATDEAITNIVREYAGITETVYTLPSVDSLVDGAYYWAVRMHVGADSSSLQRFPRLLRVDNVAPLAIRPQSPGDGSYIDNPNIGFYFPYETGTPPPAVAPDYNVFELASDPDFTIGVSVIEPLADFTYVPSSPFDQGRYYWRVQRADSAGNAAAVSTTYDFLIDTEAPAVPTVTYPADGGASFGDTIVFRWATDDPATWEESPEYYYVHISSTPDFSDWNTFANFVYADSLVFDATGLVEFESYYWRVKALDSAGFYTSYSDAASFLFAEAMCGDVNHDDKVNLADITGVISYVYLDGEAPDPITIGDVNGDGKINLADVTGLVDHVYISGNPLECATGK